MDNSNYADVCGMAPHQEQIAKVYRMADFCRKYNVSEIPDPYYERAEGFEYVLDLLEDACAALADSIAEQSSAESV